MFLRSVLRCWLYLSGKDIVVVYMQNNEPISLFCADETDG